MSLLRLFIASSFVILASHAARGAINPEEFMRAATEVVQVRELARVIENDRATQPRRQRISLLVEVLAVERASDARVKPGATLLIDYAIDLVDLEKRQRAYAARPPMPGPQFMRVPSAPQLGESGTFTAYLAAPQAALRSYAGTPKTDAGERSGWFFVPAAGQYSFRVP